MARTSNEQHCWPCLSMSQYGEYGEVDLHKYYSYDTMTNTLNRNKHNSSSDVTQLKHILVPSISGSTRAPPEVIQKSSSASSSPSWPPCPLSSSLRSSSVPPSTTSHWPSASRTLRP
mmetsp:Transcript_26061/g.43953  ORF Transcript_26061/g.43953 Transcript_26061/m.43953 type:complete len:117 (-) Transcript_26061:6263-6613(-)